MPSHREDRVLVLAPLGKDASLARDVLCRAGIVAEICAGSEDLSEALDSGAGCLLATQEALAPGLVTRLLDALHAQPPWSDLPLVLLVTGGAEAPADLRSTIPLVQQTNVSLLERPVRIATLLSVVQAALRARRRQYEVRDLLLARARAEEAEHEARLIAEDAVRIRDEFLSSVAHDLRNPLTAIKAYAQILRHQARTGSLQADVLVQGLLKIEGVVAKATTQIDELLDLARLQGGQPLELNKGATDLVGLSRQVAAQYQLAGGEHNIRVDTKVAQLVGMWDAIRLERVIGNLLSNAIKYSPEGGEISLEVGWEERAGTICGILVVRDQGIGIPESELPHISERFYRASNTRGRMVGTGLGLAGVRQIIEQHGGSMSVASQEGHGSVFTVRLPMA
ncbi:MAG: HAMP domain-containing histidine kinase [Chloroflexota bacterium]|nr:HAMP domain-containing histidine kinase [Chloroflexota bacterium]